MNLIYFILGWVAGVIPYERLVEGSVARLYAILSESEGRSYLILGNGPSLSGFNQQSVDQYDQVIVCNHFYNTDIAVEVRPDFYCASDPRLFFPIDFKWLRAVSKLRPRYLVIPSRYFYLRFFYWRKILFFNVAEGEFLWDENVKPVMDLKAPIPNGDTVVCDISIPLACALKANQISFAGLNLEHSPQGVSHAYNENEIKSKRRDDDYLANIWPAKAQMSFRKQVSALARRNIQITSLSNGQVAENLMLNADKIISKNDN